LGIDKKIFPIYVTNIQGAQQKIAAKELFEVLLELRVKRVHESSHMYTFNSSKVLLERGFKKA